MTTAKQTLSNRGHFYLTVMSCYLVVEVFIPGLRFVMTLFTIPFLFDKDVIYQLYCCGGTQILYPI